MNSRQLEVLAFENKDIYKESPSLIPVFGFESSGYQGLEEQLIPCYSLIFSVSLWIT